MIHWTWRLALSVCAAVVGISVPLQCHASAVGLEFDLLSLGAPNRYEYRYTLSNLALGVPLSWFSVDFDTALYDESTLAIVSSGLTDWSEQILGSVFANPAQYDAFKFQGPGLAIGGQQTGFAVDFTWLGPGTPGSQAFIVYDPATFGVLDSGVSTAKSGNGVPEPGTMALVLLALCGAAASRQALARRTPGARLSPS